MNIIDAHQHFWRRARGDYRWLDPQNADLAPICHDFEPDDLQPLLARHNVVGTVLVQAADSEAETEYLLSLASRHAVIAGVVGWVDLSDPAAVATLERWAGHPKFKGVRPMLQDLPDPDWIAHAPHPDVVRALVRLGLRFDALVQPQHLPALLRFLQAWPELPAVIDHAAKPQLAQGWQAGWAEAWKTGMQALADLPQVSCKFSGLLTEAGGPARQGGAPAVTALTPVWDLLIEAFGPRRLMWGSDWPVLNLATHYDHWLHTAAALAALLARDDQARVFGGTATAFYNLDIR